METTAAKFISKAARALEDARFELTEPEDDVMAFTICRKAYHASCWLLTAWLESENIEYNIGSTLPELIKLCREKNSSFEKFDFEGYACIPFDITRKNYCVDVPQVKKCHELAVKLQEFLRNELLLNIE